MPKWRECDMARPGQAWRDPWRACQVVQVLHRERERWKEKKSERERESATEKCRAELSVQAEASHVCERVNRTEIKSHKDTEKKENEK